MHHYGASGGRGNMAAQHNGERARRQYGMTRTRRAGVEGGRNTARLRG